MGSFWAAHDTIIYTAASSLGGNLAYLLLLQPTTDLIRSVVQREVLGLIRSAIFDKSNMTRYYQQPLTPQLQLKPGSGGAPRSGNVPLSPRYPPVPNSAGSLPSSPLPPGGLPPATTTTGTNPASLAYHPPPEFHEKAPSKAWKYAASFDTPADLDVIKSQVLQKERDEALGDKLDEMQRQRMLGGMERQGPDSGGCCCVVA